MQKIVSFIPHLFTLGNLFCGCLAIIYAFNWQLDWAAYMVFLAAFLDFFDGFFARLLKVEGELGKQLDSLADMVSFGVVPGIVIYQLLRFYESLEIQYSIDTFQLTPGNNEGLLPYIALLIPVFSCYRLAKFNIDTRQSSGFLGLPTPANAIFFVSIAFIVFSFFMPPFDTTIGASAPMKNGLSYAIIPFITNKYVLIALVIVFSLLLVSNLPLFALKFKNFGWADNKIRYIFLALCIVLLILFQLIAIPFIVILYILTSIVNNIFKLTV